VPDALGGRRRSSAAGVEIGWRSLSDGHHRDSAHYSVIDSEWPQVRERLSGAVAAAAALRAPRGYS
jgi:hypothetical protein